MCVCAFVGTAQAHTPACQTSVAARVFKYALYSPTRFSVMYSSIGQFLKETKSYYPPPPPPPLFFCHCPSPSLVTNQYQINSILVLPPTHTHTARPSPW